MTNFDYDKGRDRFDVEDELEADRRYRSFIIRARRGDAELPNANATTRELLESELERMDRRITLNTLRLAQLETAHTAGVRREQP